MNQRRFLLAALIIAVVIVVSFVISVPHTTREVVVQSSDKELLAPPPIVTLKDVYKKGVHTLSGSLVVPTACTRVGTQARVSDGIIHLGLTLLGDSDLCLMVPTTTTFVATTTAASGLPVIVMVDGRLATTTPQ